jgi:hypothetical protein
MMALPGLTRTDRSTLRVLVAAVLVLHLALLAWFSGKHSVTGTPQWLTDPEFNHTLALDADAQARNGQPVQGINAPAMSTVGQVVQARTVTVEATPAGPMAPEAPRHHRPERPKHKSVAQPTTAQPSPWADPAATQPPEIPARPLPADGAEVTASHAGAAYADATPPPVDSPPLPPPQLAKPATEATAAQGAHPENNEQKVASPLIRKEITTTNSDSESSAWLGTWPISTRLSYQLKGYFRGDFSGNARVQWLRADQRYKAQVDVSVALLFNLRMTSQGRITPQHLWPEVYEEVRRGKTRGVRLGDQLVHLDNGNTVPRVADLQDSASLFVQLAQDFAQGRVPLRVGTVVRVWLARPGGVDEWVYDVVALDTLFTPLGDIQAYHLQPRPQANGQGAITMDMWFAPALQHLPARIRLTLNTETWLDLTLEKVEQSD